MVRVLKTIGMLACLVLLPTLAFAQASITGVVKDASGAVLPGVTVEAASPVLIEKTRSAVTDGTGQYRIVDLRPGTYTVTFTLPGFSTVKREGIELTGSFIATINADMKVGGVAETITVSGETPIVDVQSVRRQTTLSNEMLTTIPTARSWAATAVLIPGIVDSGRQRAADIQVTPQMTVFGGAGGRSNEGRMQVDGLNTGAGAQRRRRVDLRRRHLERAGSRDDDLGRPRRSRSRRPDAEHRPEERRQHGQGRGLPVGRQQRHGRQQLQRRAEGRRARHARASCSSSGTTRAASAGRSRRIGCGTTARCATKASTGSIPGIFPNLNAGDPTKFTVRAGHDAAGAGRRELPALRACA